METLNCMRCKYRHEDNGNCTAVGGFCTAVTAAHCPLLRDFLDAGLTPAEVHSMSGEWGAMMSVLNGIGSYDRLRELAEADKAGRLVVLPCQSEEHVFALLDGQKRVRECEVKYAVLDGWLKVFYLAPIDDPGNLYSAPFGAFGQSVFLTREEAEKALEARKDD